MSRWKGKGAKAVAAGAPLSGLYDEIRAWAAPLDCALSASGGIAKATYEQTRILCATGFGSQIVSSKLSSEIESVSSSEGRGYVFQLMLEEVFYLSYELHSLRVYSDKHEELTPEQLWCLMQEFNKDFARLYKAYSHLRNKRWVVRPGPQYGADFMAYRHHPTLVHSDYAVLVMGGDDSCARLTSWTDIQGMTRLCGSVAKVLLVLYIMADNNDEASHNASSVACLTRLAVQEVEVRRWLPEKHREKSYLAS